MVDGISFRFDSKSFHREMVRIDREVNRATMYTVRAAGRTVKSAAKRKTPVYKGDRPEVVRGLLKGSIHSDKRLTKIPGGYMVTVAPRGAARRYASKIEEQVPFMEAGLNAARDRIGVIADKAWTSACRGR